MGSDSYAGKIVMTDESGGASAGTPMEIALADDIVEHLPRGRAVQCAFSPFGSTDLARWQAMLP